MLKRARPCPSALRKTAERTLCRGTERPAWTASAISFIVAPFGLVFRNEAIASAIPLVSAREGIAAILRIIRPSLLGDLAERVLRRQGGSHSLSPGRCLGRRSTSGRSGTDPQHVHRAAPWK